MKRISVILILIFLLSLLSVPFGAAELVTVTSPARLSEVIASAENMAVINLSSDMSFGDDLPCLYVNKSLVLRGDKTTPVTLTEGRFCVEGEDDLPVTVVFENISFISSVSSPMPAVEVKGNVNITFSGCTFEGYSASAVRILADGNNYINAVFKGCTFKYNATTDCGGGIAAMGRDSNLTLNLTGCVFEGNGSVDGGGLFFSGATATLTGCTFKDNGAKSFGGGLYGEDSQVTLKGCVFGLNSAKGKGGGIALLDVKLTMLDCVVARNGAKTAGGGLWLKETEHPDSDSVWDYIERPDRSVNIDNCSFYLNEVVKAYSSSQIDTQAAEFELLGQNEVNIRLSTFAYHEGEQTLYDDPYVNFFGCILEGDGLERELPSAQNGYCLIYEEEGSEPILDSEYRLTDFPHLNCVNDSPDLRIPLEAVKEAYGGAFSGYYGAFPVGDNSGEVVMTFVFHSLRTQVVKASRGNPIPEIPAPMRDMYSFGGWYLPDGNKLAGYRLLVGGDVSSIEISPLWTHNTRYYLTLAGCGVAIACGAVGWIVVRRRMRNEGKGIGHRA